MRRVLLIAMLVVAGCAAPQPKEPSVDTGVIVGSVSEPRNRARLHTELAGKYYSIGRMAVALDELRQATAADPNYALAYSMYGTVYMALRENRLAQQSFDRALSLDSDNPDINHNYAVFLCENGHEEDAIRHFMKAVANPLYTRPWTSYSAAGVCAMRAKNYKDAEDYFQRALKLNPNERVALIKLAEIRYAQGNLAEARQFVNRFHRLGSDSSESLWLALRVSRRLGDADGEASYATRLRRKFPGSPEYQLLQRGEYN